MISFEEYSQANFYDVLPLFLDSSSIVIETIIKPDKFATIEKLNEIKPSFLKISFFCLKEHSLGLFCELFEMKKHADEIITKEPGNRKLSVFIDQCINLIDDYKGIENILFIKEYTEEEIKQSDIDTIKTFISRFEKLLSFNISEEMSTNAT